MDFYSHSVPLLIGCAADFVFGDPRRLPHPVRFFGAVISRGEFFLNRGKGAAFKGAFLAVAITGGCFWFFSVLESSAASAGVLLHTAFSSMFVFFGLAGASLTAECGAVFSALESGDAPLARRRLSMIVGRDTDGLDPARIKTATLETMSENLSDGVVAPIFFYMLGGVPAMMAYKAVNTLDSMVGYKNSRYKEFGMFSARMDDAANFIPARATAFLMALSALSRRSFVFIFKFGRNHPSPNAGFPQAALAGILNIRFGGPSSYGGETVRKPFIGENPEEATKRDYEISRRVNRTVMAVSVSIAVVLRTVF